MIAVRHGLFAMTRAAAAPTAMQRAGLGEGGSSSRILSRIANGRRSPRAALTRRP